MKLILEVMSEAGCGRVNVVEAIEAAKVEYKSSSPTVDQILQVLLGEDTDPGSDSDQEEQEVFSQKIPQKVSLSKIRPISAVIKINSVVLRSCSMIPLLKSTNNGMLNS